MLRCTVILKQKAVCSKAVIATARQKAD